MKSVKKYAIRFPGVDTYRNQESLSIFSENRIIETQKTFSLVLNDAERLAGFIIQKNRTRELGKCLLAQKEALDVEIENKEEQLRIRYIEESERLKIRMETEKKDLDIKFQKLMMESAKQAKEFEFSFERYMSTNQSLHAIVLHEKKIIEDNQSYIELLATDYSNRREYILYCEIERKSIELINEYVRQMVWGDKRWQR